jgi:hypothetical protein
MTKTFVIFELLEFIYPTMLQWEINIVMLITTTLLERSTFGFHSQKVQLKEKIESFITVNISTMKRKR